MLFKKDKTMRALCLISLVMVCAVCGSEKTPNTVYGILGDVMKEQLGVIKHCMVSRCTGKPHRRFRNIAFQAHPSKDLKDIPKKTKVVFDIASENIGHAYDSNTGIFTVPVDGAYVFHWTTLVPAGKYFSTDLIVNGIEKARNHGYAQNSKDWNSPSQMFVGSLKKGDRVWLSTDNNVGQHLYRGSYSTFSGFLL